MAHGARAVRALGDPTIAAVFGHFAEWKPDQSIYHRVLDLDWSRETGEVEAFGGIVMIRRKCLMQTGGFPEDTLTGEDPVLALGIRRRGYRVLQLPAPMADHDLDIHDFATYWTRSVRTGIAHAEQVAAKRRLGIRFRDTRTARNLRFAGAGRSRSRPASSGPRSGPRRAR